MACYTLAHDSGRRLTMGYFSRLFGSFKRGADLPTSRSSVLDDALDAQARHYHAVQPDTRRQWQYLNVALQQRAVPGKQRRPAGALRLLGPAFSYGGIFVIVLIIAGIVWLNRSSVVTYETGRGQQSAIILSDSSEVTLNHTTTLIVETRPFGDTRHVSLKGEAFFHVRRNGSPFIVTTDAGTVQVLGTEFNIRIREQLLVGVVSGSVKVTGQHDGMDSAVVVRAGQIVTCPRQGYPGTPASLPFADYPGWNQGKFLFYRTSLLSACEEIESQFDVQIRIESRRTLSETITGVVDGRSAGTAIAALSNLTGNKVRHENSVYTLY